VYQAGDGVDPNVPLAPFLGHGRGSYEEQLLC